MCENCYIEAGSPEVINDKTIMAAKLIDLVYEQENCGAGGYCHIVIDDWNLGNEDISFCLKEIEKDEDVIERQSRVVQVHFLEYFKNLSIEERYSAMAIHSQLIQP